MRLLIAIGYNSRNENPGLVYLGRSGVEMDAAIAAAPFQTIEKIHNPSVIRKNNARAAENAKAEKAAFDAEVKQEQETYNAAVLLKAEELAAGLRAEHAAELQKLRDESASALAAADGAHRAELAKKDTELASLRAELKAAKAKGSGKSSAGAAPSAQPDLPANGG